VSSVRSGYLVPLHIELNGPAFTRCRLRSWPASRLYHRVGVGVGVTRDRAADIFTALGGIIGRSTRVGDCVGWVCVEEEAEAVQPVSFPPRKSSCEDRTDWAVLQRA
jgi:hypothetical protein